MISVLEVVTPEGARREILRHEGARLEAPNWSPCGKWLLVNSAGLLWKVPLAAPVLIPLPTGLADRCNNDHGFTRDGRIIFSSHYEGQGAQIYVMPEAGLAAGTQPEKLSPAAPSWFHSLSPDGGTLLYPAVRGASPGLEIYALSLAGGAERRLTGTGAQSSVHNDGPDFSHDGSRIYWNSDRDGHAQIWRMRADGSDPAPLFTDAHVNWFPHPSPCGQHLCWLSYPPGTMGHPADLPVRLMRSDAEGRGQRVLAEITGGQGTLNVPSWAPDGSAFAFIRYEG